LRLRLLIAVATAAVLVGSGLTGAASAGPGPSASGRGAATHIASSPDATLYSQNDNDAGVGIVSQNFEVSLDAYDSASADDFVVPAGFQWGIQQVVVTGVYFNGPGPALNETVTFYADAGGLPGAVVKSVTAVGADTAGSFVIPLKVKLMPGTYWVSVVVNMDFTPNGEWGWETRTLKSNKGAAWENPGDGFLSGCTTWARMPPCIGNLGEGPDFMFALNGKAKPIS